MSTLFRAGWRETREDEKVSGVERRPGCGEEMRSVEGGVSEREQSWIKSQEGRLVLKVRLFLLF